MRLFITALVVLLGATSLTLPASTIAQEAQEIPPGEGRIEGTILNGTTGEPAPDVEVTLTAAGSTGMLGQATTMTDQEGRYIFEGLSVDPEVVYVTAASYRNVRYSSDMITFPAGELVASGTGDLTIYETTDQPSDLRISSRGLILAGVSSSLGELNIVDVTTLELGGDRTLVPNDLGRTVEFGIPRNASSVSPFPASGFEFGTPEIEGSSLFASSPLLPGSTSATVGYTIPYTGDSLSIELQSPYTIDSLRILIPLSTPGIDEGLTINAAGLTFQGETTVGDQEYRLWTANDVSPGTRVRISYVELPASEVSPNTLSKLEPTVLAIVGAIAAAGIVGFLVYRRKLYVPRPATLVPALAVSLGQRREELTQQLRRLERAHDEGIVGDEDYAEYRSAILEQLRLISRQQRGVGLDE